ncbi:type VI secretion system protein ImpL [Bryocella elongata]|uniref:Type VI secretion system protein ImpL n=1 Tax=Bryocella elongata TaxID=863522 RepID=A0A1H6ABK4_9BACT|nr:ImcF-related family protein [Bryocella elongata]SEG46139.1 type VI secretion system protein ImpL [Bryocella elongata]
MKKALLIGIPCLLVYLVLIVLFAFAAHLEGMRFGIFVGVMSVVGIAALVAIVIYQKKMEGDALPSDLTAAESSSLDSLVKAAEHKLKGSSTGKSLSGLPLVYLVGDSNSAKTHTLVQSGLDPELLAGEVYRDGQIAPTPLANIWYTGHGIIVDAGGALLDQPSLWARLVRLTQPNKYGAALAKGGLQPTRAVLLCVSLEHLAPGQSPDAARVLGQKLRESLRKVSQTLGISLPVYVLFTKLDTVGSFADYATNLTEEEVRQPLGAMLARVDADAGLYGERAAAQTTSRFDELVYSLGEFRLEVLGRGSAPEQTAKAYEFPRELRKLRGPIVDFLVEVGRPSQLGVNPFLRGFYFSGVRPRVIEDSGPVSQAAAPAAAVDPGATRVFSFNAAQIPAIPTPVQRVTRRVPQWVFLPHLLPRVILSDRTALDTSRASTKVNVVKRVLIGTVAAFFFLYFVALTLSWLNNSGLDDKLKEASAAAVAPTGQHEGASVADLQHLEALRKVFMQIDDYHSHGAPLAYRFGLYGSEPLYEKACTLYGARLRAMLLEPAQANILAQMSALPAAWDKNSAYSDTYRPLRAYLISTSNPEKATPDVADDFVHAWVGARSVSQEQTDLARTQFQTYAALLPQPKSCMATLGGEPHMSAVTQARNFLRGADGSDQVYQSMKAAADRKFPGVNFNRQFPAYVAYVSDSYDVEGAFTKGGFTFMQDAIQHPEPYASGEEWVLGFRAANTVDIPSLRAQLAPKYLNDFLNAWRSYLKAAHVLTGGDLPEAKKKLHVLAGSGSPMMQVFKLISDNTAVNIDDFSKPFQAPQMVVAPNSLALPPSYTGGLEALDNAIPEAGTPITPAVADPVIQAANAASAAVNTIRSAFPPDPTGAMDSTSEALLQAPIKSALAAAKGLKDAAAGGGAKVLCAQMAPLLNKFPFNPDAHDDADPSEVARIFQPGSGAFAQYAQTQSANLTLIGSQFTANPTANLNPAFVTFMNHAQQLSTALFATGATPQLVFSLTEEPPAAGQPPAVIEINGTALSGPGQKSFTWVSSAGSTTKISGPQGQSHTYPGNWSVFHFAYEAKHPTQSQLELIFQESINGHSTGTPYDYKLDASGPGAPLLNPAFMRQMHCTTKVNQ